jgi:hypothetical protein
MKKLLASISVLVYFVMSCGIVVNLHYCMGRIQSVEFYGSEKEICDRCGMHINESHGCCKEEVKIFKLQNDQNKAGFNYTIDNFKTPVFEVSPFMAGKLIDQDVSNCYNDHSPPLLKGQETYLQNCVFRI